MEGFAVAEGDGGREAGSTGEKSESGFGEREGSEFVEGICGSEEILIVHADDFFAEADIVVDVLSESAVGGDEGFEKGES